MTPTFSDLVTVEDTPLSHISQFVVVNIGSMSCSLMAVLITRSNGRYYSADTHNSVDKCRYCRCIHCVDCGYVESVDMCRYLHTRDITPPVWW